jgi:hypothetical protein
VVNNLLRSTAKNGRKSKMRLETLSAKWLRANWNFQFTLPPWIQEALLAIVKEKAVSIELLAKLFLEKPPKI